MKRYFEVRSKWIKSKENRLGLCFYYVATRGWKYGNNFLNSWEYNLPGFNSQWFKYSGFYERVRQVKGLGRKGWNRYLEASCVDRLFGTTPYGRMINSFGRNQRNF